MMYIRQMPAFVLRREASLFGHEPALASLYTQKPAKALIFNASVGFSRIPVQTFFVCSYVSALFISVRQKY